jgi:hypothetical protein
VLHNWCAGYVIRGIRARLTVSPALFPSPTVNLQPSDLTEPIDIYSEWIDAADAAQREEQVARRPVASSSRPVPAPASVDSDDE